MATIEEKRQAALERAQARAEAEQRARKRLQQAGSVMAPAAVPGDEPLPPLSERLSNIGMAGLRSAVTGGGIMGGVMGAGSEAFKQGMQGLDRAAYKTGGAVTDALSDYVPPEVAGGAGYGANVALQAVPAALGAATGRGAQQVVTKPFKAAYKAGRNFVDPWLPGGVDRAVGRTALEAAGPKRQAVIEALRQNKQLTPGSMPTAGEAAAPAGSAEFSGLQRVVEGKAPSQYMARGVEQEAARVAALRQVGKTPADVAAAEGVRGASAKANYGAVADEIVRPDMQLQRLAMRPSFEKAFARAKKLTEEQGRVWGDTVQDYQNLKMAMDDMIRDPKTFGMGASEANALGGTRSEFVDWLSKASPGWEKARSTYAAQSTPINQMRVGQELEKSLTNSLGTAERPAALANAVRNAPQTMKRATGQPRYDTLDEVLDPQQMQSVTGVMDDLKRSALHEQLAKAGTEKARDLVGQAAPSLPQAGMFNPKYSVLRALSNRLSGKVQGQSVDRLAEAMQDPQLMAKLMTTLEPADRSAVMAWIMKNQNIPGTTIGGMAGGGLGYESGRSP